MVQLLLPLGIAALFTMPVAAHAQLPDELARPYSHTVGVSPANPAGIITRAMAIEMAMQANLGLAAARWEIEASEGALRQAGVLPNPVLATSVEDTRQETRTIAVQITQPLELGGKRSARIAAAERSKEVALAELQIKRAEVRAAVMAAFYEVMSAQERLDLTKAAAELANRATAAASKRVAAGKVSPVEGTRARVAESNVRIELAQAQSELATARHRLAAIWGARQAQFDRVDGGAGDLPFVPEWNALAARLAYSPNLVRARAEVERRQALARVERSQQVPDITVSIGAQRNEELGRNQALLGVSIPLPFFDRNQGNMQEAISRSYQAQDELAAAEVRLQSDLAQSYERLRTARQQAELFQAEIVPGAQSAYEAAVKGFEFGKFSFLDVLDAQRTLFQSRLQQLRALSEAHQAAAALDRLLGEPTQAIAQ